MRRGRHHHRHEPQAAEQTRATAPKTTPQTTPTPHAHRRNPPGSTGDHHAHEPSQAKPTKPPPIPPGVANALHDYVAAMDGHDGAALCAAFVPGGLGALDLPRGRGCSGLAASLGYDPGHGLPVWTGAELAQIKSVARRPDGVRATVEMVDHYRDNPQPSIEDDVIFLRSAGDGWRIEQPSVTLYRAIGVPDPPPSVFAAPKG